MGGMCWLVIIVKGLQSSTWRRWKLGITGVIIGEWLLMTPMGFPLIGTTNIGDSVVLQSVKEMDMHSTQRLLRIPVRGPNVVFQQALFEQTVHEQPLWMNPNRPDPSTWFDITDRTR